LKAEVNARAKKLSARMTIPICLVQFFTRGREDAKDREECRMEYGIMSKEF
jgi:hypothetical protein